MSLTVGTVDDEVAHRAAAAGHNLVKVVGGDRGEILDQGVFLLFLERLVEAPDEMFENVS